MSRTILTAIVSILCIASGCKTADQPKPAAPAASATPEAPKAAAPVAPKPAAPAAPAVPAAAKKWHDGVAGTYKGVVGGNNDEVVFTFEHAAGELTASYTIDDPQFNPKPYKGKLMKFTETKGKELTLTCRYADEMNAGAYEITFSKDLKQLTGTYIIDGEGESDGNSVTATKQ